MKNLQFTVLITVAVPETFNPEDAYVYLPAKIGVENDEICKLDSHVVAYETIDVSTVKE